MILRVNVDFHCWKGDRSLRVLDGLVFCFSAVDGVWATSLRHWRLADNYKVARTGFVNKNGPCRVPTSLLKCVKQVFRKCFR